MVKIWDLDDAELPEDLHNVRAVFLQKKEQRPSEPIPRGDRKPSETLHDYLTRKNIPCFCRKCAAERKTQALKLNATLV